MTAIEVAIVSGIGIPILGFLVVISVQWGGLRTEVRNINRDLIDIVKDKDRVHQELVAQMREDRKATDRRLTWLEQNLWKR